MNPSLRFYGALVVSSLFFANSTFAAPVITFCSSGPGIDLVNDGCISGSSSGYPGGGDGIYSNAGGGDPLSKVEQAIFGATGVAVELELYGKSDDDPGLFNFTPVDPEDSQSGTFSVIDGTLIYYITVKAANSFSLYQLAPPSATGSYSTDGLLTPNGNNQPDVSHLSFWVLKNPPVAQVPEPMSMALLLVGGLLVSLRRLW